MRATGVGSAVAVGRTGAIVSGFVGSWAIDAGGSTAFFAVMAGCMGLTFVSLAVIDHHVKAKTA